MIEWDANIPAWPVLYAEAMRAEAVMLEETQGHAASVERRHAVAG